MGSSKTSSEFSDDSATETQYDSSSRTHTDNEIDDDTAAHDPNPSFDSAPFSQGDMVLAYHNVRLYEAKVLCTQFFYLYFSPCSPSY